MIAPAPPPPPPLFLPHCTSPPPAEPVCWQALRAAPDGRTAGLAPEERAYQLALYSDLREAGTGCLPPGIEGFDNRTVEGKFVLQVLPWRRAAPSIGGVSAPPMGCGASPHLARSSGRAGSRPGRRAAPGGVHAARLLSAAISHYQPLSASYQPVISRYLSLHYIFICYICLPQRCHAYPRPRARTHALT